VDRHAHIGEGWIGNEGFRIIVNDPRFKKLPGCLETPKSKDLKEDIQNLATLRSLVTAGVSGTKRQKPSIRGRPPKADL
jgi:deoxyribonuclease-4